jgi:hypothetical protein
VLGPLDVDADGVPDDVDSCVKHANADQRDTDGDGFGNLCDPDLNNDAIVNFVDLGEFKSLFFSGDPDADFDGDGFVNFVDLGILKGFFFLPPGPVAIRWTSSSGGDWNDPANWSPAVLPGPTHTVRIDVPDDVAVTHGSGDTQVESLIGNERLVVSGGSFEAATTVQVNDVLELGGLATLRNAHVLAPEGARGAAGGVLIPVGDAATLDSVTLGADLTVESTGSLTVSNGLTLEDASVTLLNDGFTTTLRVSGDAGTSSTLGGTGEVVFGGTSDTHNNFSAAGSDHELIIGAGITVRTGTAGGRIRNINDTAVTIEGTILSDLGGHTIALAASPLTVAGALRIGAGGVIDVNSDMTLTGSALVSIEIAGPDSALFGRLTATGDALTLDGSLEVTLADGFVPAPCAEFEVITWGTRVGEFAAFSGPDLGGETFALTYLGNSLVLTAPGPCTPGGLRARTSRVEAVRADPALPQSGTPLPHHDGGR